VNIVRVYMVVKYSDDGDDGDNHNNGEPKRAAFMTVLCVHPPCCLLLNVVK